MGIFDRLLTFGTGVAEGSFRGEQSRAAELERGTIRDEDLAFRDEELEISRMRALAAQEQAQSTSGLRDAQIEQLRLDRASLLDPNIFGGGQFNIPGQGTPIDIPGGTLGLDALRGIAPSLRPQSTGGGGAGGTGIEGLGGMTMDQLWDNRQRALSGLLPSGATTYSENDRAAYVQGLKDMTSDFPPGYIPEEFTMTPGERTDALTTEFIGDLLDDISQMGLPAATRESILGYFNETLAANPNLANTINAPFVEQYIIENFPESAGRELRSEKLKSTVNEGLSRPRRIIPQ